MNNFANFLIRLYSFFCFIACYWSNKPNKPNKQNKTTQPENKEDYGQFVVIDSAEL